jgi:glycerol-3-phosphate dehydrogenase
VMLHEMLVGHDSLGTLFGEMLGSIEIDWLIDREWAQCADDIMWRRTKLGLHLSEHEEQHLIDYIEEKMGSLEDAKARSL